MASPAAMLADGQRLALSVSGGKTLAEVCTESLLSRKEGGDSHREKLRREHGPRHQLTRQKSFKKDIGHVARRIVLIIRLSFKVLQYQGVGYYAMTKLLALVCYAITLFPGFLQVAYYYFFSSRVKRSVVYGDQPRNRLDLYLPDDIYNPKPVLIFVTGGAWIIGYKGWGSLLGLQLAERGIIVASIDYRNFPQGTISDMVKDSSQGISFVINNIALYGGDPNRIYLMGQSAGAHISSCALLDQAIRESQGESISWSVSQIKAYFGLSGVYNLLGLVDHFHKRGLSRSTFLSIMEGKQALEKFSPEVKLLNLSLVKDAALIFPRMILFHGAADFTVPSYSSKRFADALKKVGARAELVVYDGKTHTDLFIHDLLRGGKDDLFDQIVAFIHSGDDEALAEDAIAPPRRRLMPEFLLKLAQQISPL